MSRLVRPDRDVSDDGESLLAEYRRRLRGPDPERRAPVGNVVVNFDAEANARRVSDLPTEVVD